MNNRLDRLRQHRELLVLRADLQRAVLAAQARLIRRPFQLIDGGIAFARRLRAHPVLATLTLFAGGFVLRRHLRRVVGLGWSAWRMYKFALARMHM